MKKYVPNGYQIISVAFETDNIATPSEDAELLKSIIENKKFDKPILLTVDATKGGYYIVSGFATVRGLSVVSIVGHDSLGQYIIYSIYVESGDLKIAIVEQ